MTWSPESERRSDCRHILYVMGAIDEFRATGIIEINGDEPLTEREHRRDYRLLKKTGYMPTMEQVDDVLRRCVQAENLPGFRELFKALLDHGWTRLRKERAIAKADEVAPKLGNIGDIDPDGWMLL